MKSQIFLTIGVALVASVLLTGLASQIYAQSNMTGGMAGVGNMSGGNMTIIDTIDDGDGNSGDGGSDEDDGKDGSN
jgi:hypothetical protein